MADSDAERSGVCGTAKTGRDAVDTGQVLIEEYCWLNPTAAAPATLEAYYEAIRDRQAALCLSGGGIRSAAFALGVMQALSRKRLLTQFQYLSTVSGGGYIGGFVQRWISEMPRGATDVMGGLRSPVEPVEISRLRQNSNFITPRVGLASNDTWTAIALSVRNIVINWFLFFPLFMILAVLPNWFWSGVASTPTAVSEYPWFDDVLVLFAGVCIAMSVIFMVPMLPSYRDRSPVPADRGDRWMFWLIVMPLLVWSVAGTIAISPELLDLGEETKGDSVADLGGFALASVTFVATLVGLVIAAFRVERAHRKTFAKDILVWLLSLATVSLWVMLGAYVFDSLTILGLKAGASDKWLTVLGPLWLLSGTLAGAIFFAAFRWAEGSKVKPDADREWIARVSGMKLKPMLAWAIAGFSALLLMAILGPWLGENLTWPSLVALVAGTGAVGGGRSERSGSHAAPAPTAVLRYIPVSGLATLATFVFVVALIVVLGSLEERLAERLAIPFRGLFVNHKVIDPLVVAHSVILVGFGILLVAMSRLIPVNRFSLNGLYRNRLARAFLGAARPDRDPNPFTGFDSADNIRLHLLRAGDPQVKPRVLYPVINCALNVSVSNNLAWQERKAEPFVFTPLFSGSGMLAGGSGAYVSSKCYGGSEHDAGLGVETTGVTLATAMSISGAAATPNRGYNSSAATAFLMTLFNVRLGAWLPNPAVADDLGKNIGRSGPSNSLRAILRELAGSTDDRGKDVYLSDGGHFEMLGVYEMLRRRCRYMVVSDAGADPQCAFADLGNAVRKAKIDLNCDVDFGKVCISSRDQPIKPRLSWAIGDVTYEGGAKGTILYLKPSYWDQELPIDIVSYAKQSPSFPHESTGDQWFSESQFESYRHLGFYFTDKLGPAAKSPSGKVTTIAEFFEAACADYGHQLKVRRARAAAKAPAPADP